MKESIVIGLKSFGERKAEPAIWDGGEGTGDELALQPTGYKSRCRTRQPREKRVIKTIGGNEIVQTKGHVKWFNVERGYGFIQTVDYGDIFVHHSAIKMDGFRQLEEGQTVALDIGRNDRGQFAQNVSVIYESEGAR